MKLPTAAMPNSSSKSQNTTSQQKTRMRWDLSQVPHPIRSLTLRYLFSYEKYLNRKVAIKKLSWQKFHTFSPKETVFHDGKTRVTKTLMEDKQKAIHDEYFDIKISFAETQKEADKAVVKELFEEVKTALNKYCAGFATVALNFGLFTDPQLEAKAIRDKAIHQLVTAGQSIEWSTDEKYQKWEKFTLKKSAENQTRIEHAKARKEALIEYIQRNREFDDQLSTIRSVLKNLQNTKPGAQKNGRSKSSDGERSRGRSKNQKQRSSNRSERSRSGSSERSASSKSRSSSNATHSSSRSSSKSV